MTRSIFSSLIENQGLSYLPGIKFFLLQSVSDPSSFQAEKINHLFNTFNIAAGAMLLLIIGLVTYICIRFGNKKDNTVTASTRTGSAVLEFFMIGVPLLILSYFFYKSVQTEKAVSPPIDIAAVPDIIITGHQWWWEAEYPGKQVRTANEIHLPVGKHLLIALKSADVIHDWWVPQLGNKMDIIPRVSNYLWLDINKAGTYHGACSEFCGVQHAWMRITVIAQNQHDFNQWILVNTKPAALPADPISKTGAALFQSMSCSRCHAIQGTAANGVIGPDLTHIGSRQELLTGILPTTEANLFQWISHPQLVKPGAYMPDFILNKDSLQAIVHYLSQLK